LGTWFNNLWFPLFDKKNVIITNDLLSFIPHGISVGDGHPPLNSRDINKDLKKILHNYKLEYQIINYDKIKNKLPYYEKLISKDIINISLRPVFTNAS
jgi:hypothetical protein